MDGLAFMVRHIRRLFCEPRFNFAETLAAICLFSPIVTVTAGVAFPQAKPPHESAWVSETSGYHYKVRFNSQAIFADWVDLPTRLQHTPAFMRSELKKTGSKWVGYANGYLPFSYHGKTRWCQVQSGIEIDRVSPSRIEGRSRAVIRFDAGKCEPEKFEWKPFIWIPKD